MSHFIEKRQDIRIPLTFVTVEIITTDGQIKSSETCSIIDISENGMKFISKKHYQINQNILITFILPGSTIPIRADSVIIYQRPYHLLRYTGIQFTKINMIEFSLLKKYLELYSGQN